MEKQQSKPKSKILKILPKAAAAVAAAFQNPPFSPGRDHKLRSENANKSRVSMIPDEARRKPKDAETQEPVSPKISCMGQVKQKKQQMIKSRSVSHAHTRQVLSSATSTPKDTEVKKQGSKFQRMIFPRRASRRYDASASVREGNNKDADLDNKAPPMGEMRRFASTREAFANFDWKAQIAPEEMQQRNCYSDAEEEDEVKIPFSGPILGGGVGASIVPNLQPRKEINLWKRRTMAPPRPLQLKPVLTAK